VSELEDTLLFQVRAVGLPEPEREQRLIPGRRWRVDFFWRSAGLVLEVEGAVWHGGRHTTGAGFTADVIKYKRADARRLQGVSRDRRHGERWPRRRPA
jgi:hypothetical protein